MTEKDRILTLVKEGIITSQEALVLLEQLSNKETEQAVEKKEKQLARMEDLEKQDQNSLNKVLESFANVASAISAKADENSEELKLLTDQIHTKEERLEELKTLKAFEEWDVDNQMEAQRLEEELDTLMDQKVALEKDKQAIEEEMKRMKKEQIKEELHNAKKHIKETDWKKATDDSARQLGNTLSNFVQQVSNFVTKTVEYTTESVDWETREVKVPKVATHTFDHVFESPVTTASIIDFKVANGDLKVKTWEQDFVKVEGNFKIFGALNGVEPLDALLERSTITFDEEKIVVNIPNKRIVADLLIHLPEKAYDYASIKMLNGDVRLKNITGKDFYINTTNGDVLLKDLHGTMMEIDTLHGDCKLIDCEFKDVICKAMNGDVAVKSDVISSNITTVNGDIKMHVHSPSTRRVHTTSTSGDILIRVDQQLGFESVLKTSLGDLSYSRDQVELEQEVKELTVKKVELKKIENDSLPIDIDANTTTGDVSLDLV